MRWPWSWPRRDELREPRSYTDAVALGLLAQARTPRLVDGSQASAVRTVAWQTGQSFAGAVVEGLPELTPGLLACLGRESVLRGEATLRLYADGPRLGMQPVELIEGLQDGGLRVRIPGPLSDPEITIAAGEYARIRWAETPGAWVVVPPWARSAACVALAALEANAGDEASGPVGQAWPHGGPLQQPEVDIVHQQLQDTILRDLDTAAGRAVGLPSQTDKRTWQTHDVASVSPQNAAISRFGPQFSGAYGPLHGGLFAAAVASLGMPPSMVSQITPTSAYREARRGWESAIVAPALAILSRQLSAAIDREVTITLPAMVTPAGPSPADAVSRARAFGSLVEGGMAPAAAARVAGLDVTPADFPTPTPTPASA